MVIQESISGKLEVYDYGQNAWVELAALSDSNVISASVRRQCCPDGAITIGGVYAAALSLVCRLPGVSYFNVKRSRITVKSQYAGEAEPQNVGVFFALDVKRTADIFTISAQDAVGWTDTSTQNYKKRDGTDDPDVDLKYGVGAFMDYVQKHQPGQSVPANAYTNLQDWMHRLTDITARLIFGQCGIPNLVQWENYSDVANAGYDYVNSHRNTDQGPTSDAANFPFYVYENNAENIQGSARSDSPRDFFRFLAELAFGFVYANENGNLTLGQFGQPEYGWNDPNGSDSTMTVYTDEIEADSCEIADYDIQLLRAEVRGESYQGWRSSYVFNGGPDYSAHSYVRVEITEDNPFSCGWHAEVDTDLGSIAWGLWNAMKKYAGGYTIRPFRCTVHKAARFHLGQRIRLNYRAYGEAAASNYESIITSITWTFRGGWKLACGGDDGRTMLDCLRASKGDRVARDLRNSITALRDQS